MSLYFYLPLLLAWTLFSSGCAQLAPGKKRTVKRVKTIKRVPDKFAGAVDSGMVIGPTMETVSADPRKSRNVDINADDTETHLSNDPVALGSFRMLPDSVFDPPLALSPSPIDPHRKPGIFTEIEGIMLTAPLKTGEPVEQQSEFLSRALTDLSIRLPSDVIRTRLPKVLATPGEQAQIESTKPLRYPAGFDDSALSQRTDSASAGVTILVTPILDPTRSRIKLDVHAELVAMEEWIDYGEKGATNSAIKNQTGGVRLKSSAKLPVFNLRSFRSQAAIRPGEAVILKSVCGANGGEPDQLVLLHLNARLKDSDGRSMSFAEWNP